MGYCDKMCYNFKKWGDVMKTCYQKLKTLREEQGLSYEDMAKILEISKCFYWQIEHKKRRLYYDMAIKIANVFHLKPDAIFYE